MSGEADTLFDAGFYTAEYPDVATAGTDPLTHFHYFGWRAGRDPNPWFCSAWYLDANPDVRAAILDPLLHYVREGEAQGRRPSPYFDPVWYARAHRIPQRGALRHFLRHRMTEAIAPVADLYAVRHLPPYRDDPIRKVDPFLHYLEDALRDRRDAAPDAVVIAASGVFDANYYLINGSDVQEQALDPIAHYCRYGWREIRKPCFYFDTGFYRRTNPEVERLGINPLAHYILEGERAGRRPVVFFDPLWYRETYGVAPERTALSHYLAHRRGQRVSPTPCFDVAWYVSRHRAGVPGDAFAHYLRAGTYDDIDPSPNFDAGAYRKRALGRLTRHFRHVLRPERDNPLVHWLSAQYERGDTRS